MAPLKENSLNLTRGGSLPIAPIRQIIEGEVWGIDIHELSASKENNIKKHNRLFRNEITRGVRFFLVP